MLGDFLVDLPVTLHMGKHLLRKHLGGNERFFFNICGLNCRKATTLLSFNFAAADTGMVSFLPYEDSGVGSIVGEGSEEGSDLL